MLHEIFDIRAVLSSQLRFLSASKELPFFEKSFYCSKSAKGTLTQHLEWTASLILVPAGSRDIYSWCTAQYSSPLCGGSTTNTNDFHGCAVMTVCSTSVSVIEDLSDASPAYQVICRISRIEGDDPSIRCAAQREYAYEAAMDQVHRL